MGTMDYNVPESQEEGIPAGGQAEQPPEKPAVIRPLSTEGRRTQDIIGKPAISTSNGQMLGGVTDLLIDPATMRVAVLLVTRGGLFSRETLAIPMDEVQAWGQNAIMVSRPEAATPQQKTPELRKWVSAANQVRGRSIVTLDGTKVGLVSDAVIGADGSVVDYELEESGQGEAGKGKKRVPAGTTHALGLDVIVIDMGRA